jgi:two-component system sensor histidine kinase RstB
MRRLFLRIYLPLAACVVITLIISAFVVFRVIPQRVRSRQREALEEISRAVLERRPQSRAELRLLGDSLGVELAVTRRTSERRLPRRPGWVPLPGMPPEMDVRVSLESLGRDQRPLLTLLLVFVLPLLLLEGAVLYLALGPLRRRLFRLQWATESFGGGNLGIRVRPRGKSDLIESLGQTFNSMADRVENLVDAQRQLLGSVAHELRTPLARLRVALELLRDGGVNGQRVKRMEADLEELDSLVTELLGYNRLVSMDAASLDEVELGEVCAEMASAEGWADSDIELEVRGEAACQADRRLVARAVANLIRNAVRHAGSRVLVSVSKDPHGCRVAVEDDGPGLPKEPERLLRPFAKGRGSQGPGLGLAIVDRIAALHGGRVELGDSGALGGASVALVIPSTE